MRTSRRNRRDARRLFRACLKDGLLDESRARQVVARVARASRRGSLAVLSHFRRLVSLDRTAHPAVVQSAPGLPPDLEARMKASGARLYGTGVDTSFELIPALIGG